MSSSIQRTAHGHFIKGVSPNPTGRSTEAKEIAIIARAKCPEMIRVLAAIANNKSETAFARIAAANAVLDRGLGRPVTSVISNVNVDVNQNVLQIKQALDELYARGVGVFQRENFIDVESEQVVEAIEDGREHA
jgi:hypothetical protein